MLAPLRPVDLRLSGHVIHVGKSSMDVAVQLEALGKDGSEETLMLGALFHISRNYPLIIFQDGSAWFAETHRLSLLILYHLLYFLLLKKKLCPR